MILLNVHASARISTWDLCNGGRTFLSCLRGGHERADSRPARHMWTPNVSHAICMCRQKAALSEGSQAATFRKSFWWHVVG